MESLTLAENVKILRFVHTEEDFYYDDASAGEAIPRLRELVRMDAPRLTILTGPNGCGKTSLLHSLLVEEAAAPCLFMREPDRWLVDLIRREQGTGEVTAPREAEIPEERLIVFEELWRLRGKNATQEEFRKRTRTLLEQGSSVLLMGETEEPWMAKLTSYFNGVYGPAFLLTMDHPGKACRAAFGEDLALRLGLELAPGEGERLAEQYATIPALRGELIRRRAHRELLGAG